MGGPILSKEGESTTIPERAGTPDSPKLDWMELSWVVVGTGARGGG